MCHLNASVLIKGIPGSTLEFLVLRKDTSLNALAVKAVTNFPVAFDQLDQLHSCYKNVRTVSIQKVNGPDLSILMKFPSPKKYLSIFNEPICCTGWTKSWHYDH